MYRAIILDETRHIDEAWLKKYRVKRAGTLYMYDDAVSVHFCEMPPSHELHPVDVEVEHDLIFDVTDRDRERAYDDMREGEMWKVQYVHVHTLKNKGTPMRGDFESIEDAVEYALRNTPCAEWF